MRTIIPDKIVIFRTWSPAMLLRHSGKLDVHAASILIIVILQFLASPCGKAYRFGGPVLAPLLERVGVALERRKLISEVAYITTGEQYVAAFANNNIRIMYISRMELLVPASAWASYTGDRPIVIHRDLLLTADPKFSEWPTVNMYNVQNQMRLAKNMTMTCTRLVMIGVRAQLARAPGLDIMLPSLPGEVSYVVIEDAAMVVDLCYPVSVLREQAAVYLAARPPHFPGISKVDLDASQAGCLNDTSAPLAKRCWAQKSIIINVAMNGADYDVNTDATTPNGLVLLLLNTSFLCNAVMDESCFTVQKQAPLVCVLQARKRYDGGPPPSSAELPAAASSESGTVGGANGVPSGGSGNGGGGVPIPAIAGAAVAGGLLVVSLIAAVVIWRRRQRTRHGRCGIGKVQAHAGICSASNATDREAAGRASSGGGSVLDPVANREVDQSQPPPAAAGAEGTAVPGAAALPSPSPEVIAVVDARQQPQPQRQLQQTAGTHDALASEGTSPIFLYDFAVTPHTKPRPEVALGVELVQLRTETMDSPPMLTGGAAAASSAATSKDAGLRSTAGTAGGGRPGVGTSTGSCSVTGAGGASIGAATSGAGSQTAVTNTGNIPDISPAVSRTPPPVVELLPETLGKGSFGRVVVGMLNGQRVAVKLMATALPTGDHPDGLSPSNTFLQSFVQEVQVLSRVQHPNIVRLLAACVTPPKLCLVMELMETSLDRLMYGNPSEPCLPLEKVLRIGIDIANALAYLHPTIVHRDLKPANVLVNNGASDRPVVKLTDFGLSRLRVTETATNRPDAGTPPYMAPECFDIDNAVVPHHADIYSLGVILWEMMAGTRPWQGVDAVAIAVTITYMKKRLSFANIPLERCPTRMVKFIQSCWDQEPRRRPAAAEAVKTLTLILQELQRQA